MTEVTAVEVVSASTSARKPNSGETLISLVLDETGSMASCYDATISSVNDYLGSQKNLPGVCRANLYTFSAGAGFRPSFRGMSLAPDMKAARDSGKDVRPVFENRPISDVGFLDRENYKPNGMTNLYDAIGVTIRRVEAQLAPLSEVPNVLVVIVTDGGENASQEFSLDGIRTLIKQKEAEGWTFVYLGANQDAWQVGSMFGLARGQTMTYSTSDMSGTMSSLANATRAYRSTRVGASAQDAGVAERDFFTSPSKETSK